MTSLNLFVQPQRGVILVGRGEATAEARVRIK